jgi:RNA polymerase sigma-70 factor, ECF subfamily
MTSRPLPIDDSDLVLSAKQGSLEAFNMLYVKYFPVVYRRVAYLVPAEEVEDVTQEVFLSVLRSLKNFRGEAKFATWLRVLTSRQIAEYYRRRKAVSAQLDDDLPTQERCFPSDDELLLRQAFTRLPDKYQEILLLRFVDDVPFAEIARLQKRSLEGTKSFFRRAVAALAKLIEDHES